MIDAGTNANFKFYDQVPGGDKPQPDSVGDQGIRVQGGTNSSLEIDAAYGESFVSLKNSTASGALVQINNNLYGGTGYTTFGAGVTSVTISDNNDGTTFNVAQDESLNPNLQLSLLTGDGAGDTMNRSIGVSPMSYVLRHGRGAHATTWMRMAA